MMIVIMIMMTMMMMIMKTICGDVINISRIKVKVVMIM